jgi:hypothetical protein
MGMVRKQLYITQEQQHKLHTLAKQRRCTEAEVVREAIDRLPAHDDPVIRKLHEAGLLMPPPDDEEPVSDEELDRLEREWEEYLASRTIPLNLVEAVLQERAEGR